MKDKIHISCPPHHVPLSRQGYPLAVAAAGRRHVLVGEQLRGEAVDVRQHQAGVPAAGGGVIQSGLCRLCEELRIKHSAHSP